MILPTKLGTTWPFVTVRVFPKMVVTPTENHLPRDVKKEMGELIDPQVSTLNRRLDFFLPVSP